MLIDDLRPVPDFGPLVEVSFPDPMFIDTIRVDFEHEFLKISVDHDWDTVSWEVGAEPQTPSTVTPDELSPTRADPRNDCT